RDINATLGMEVGRPIADVAALDSMRQIYGGLRYLRSLYLYVRRSGQVYAVSDEAFSSVLPLEALPDASFQRLLSTVRSHQNFRPVLRQVGITTDPDLDDFVYTFLLYNYIPTDRLDFVIAMNFSPAILMDSSDGAEVYALSRSGVVQVPAAHMEPLQSVSQQEHVQRILTSPDQSGSFVYRRSDGERYLVAYRWSPDTDWVFVSEQSYREITLLPRSLRLTSFGLVGAALIVLIAFTTVSRRRLIRFARGQREAFESLRTRAVQLSGIARKKLVSDILYGRQRVDSAALGQTAAEMLLHEDENAHFAFLIVKSRRIPESDGLRRPMLDERIPARLPERCRIVESVYHRHDVVIALLHAPVPVSEAISAAERAALGLVATELECQFGLTASVNDLADIHGLANDIEHVLHLMFFDPRQLFYSVEQRNIKSGYVYPEAEEKQMLDCMLHGRPDKAKRLIASMLRGTEPFGRTVFRMVAYKLVHEIRAAIYAIEVAEPGLRSSELLAQPVTALSELDRLSDIETLLQEFDDAVDEITAIIHDSREGKRDQLIAGIDSILTVRLYDPRFHLNTIAELLGLNPQYLSRIYREETGESLPRRILSMRLDAVKRRLAETNDQVKRIITECGLPENAHFYKLFRDATGMTPKQYRASHHRAPRSQ
ncbi:MAG: helix-turn-helix domain-containing protein, partial [Spirochaetota bacterium]